ncbi:MAG: CHAT domain-containing protein [Prevotellaceae bacterium]|nr:CHAT domain-containing protein [Candidatus Minthosoma caballi]
MEHANNGGGGKQMKQRINILCIVLALLALPLFAIAQSQSDNSRTLILLAGEHYKKGEYAESVKMLKDAVPLLSDPLEIITGYNIYLLASIRCDAKQAETGLEQYANSVRNKLLPNIYKRQTEYERQLYWRMTALSIHQYAMSIALCSKSDNTKKLAYKLAQVAKNLEIEADQYARTVLAEENAENAMLIKLYDEQKDSLYLSKSDTIANSIVMKAELNKMLINERIPIGEVYDKVSDYDQVRASLPADATMVEYCIYRTVSGEDRYGAFIFDSNSEAPIALDVCSASDVDKLTLKDKNGINELYNSDLLYNTLCANISPHIKHSKLVICPVGRLEHFNFSGFMTKGMRMMEKYQLTRAVNGHRYAMAQNRTENKLESAILYGGIAYTDEQAKQAKAASKHFNFNDEERSVRGSLQYLQYSSYEVAAIRNLIKQNKIPCKLFCGKEATTGTFKSIGNQSPSVVHIATHGFCTKDTENSESKPFNAPDVYEEAKLLYSGLYFANSQTQQQSHDYLPTKNEGILTSYEISHMNLSDTQLVVLSACDTADGFTDNIEGIYGLQYAFRRSGAGAMLLNLWKVSDAISYLFMQEFYRSLFDCHDADKAYADAIEKVMKQDSNPYAWAGFVLIHN